MARRLVLFFFQAEDGIRDWSVTGVQTCALPISPLRLTKPLEAAGVPILGTAPDSIDIAEDRGRFEALADRLGITQPANGTARSVEEAVKVAERIGFPVLVRPSYVLGGRAMEIVYDQGSLRDYFEKAAREIGRASCRERV